MIEIENMEIDPASLSRFWDKVDRSAGELSCWPWRGCVRGTGGSYGLFNLSSISGWRKGFSVHQHLSVGTQADNVSDKCSRDRQARVAKNGRAKLSEATVLEIRKDFQDGIGASDIMQRYGMSETAVYAIRNNKTWKHVTQDGVR